MPAADNDFLFLNNCNETFIYKIIHRHTTRTSQSAVFSSFLPLAALRAELEVCYCNMLPSLLCTSTFAASDGQKRNISFFIIFPYLQRKVS